MLAVFRLKTSHATQKLLVVVCCTLRITSYLYLGRKQPKERKSGKNLHFFFRFSLYCLVKMSEWVRLGAILPSQLELFWMIFGLRVKYAPEDGFNRLNFMSL